MRSRRAACYYEKNRMTTDSRKPRDIRERLFEFACEIVRASQFLHTRGPIGRALSYQLLTAGTSIGANMQEADGAASRPDFIAKLRIALKEAKETWFRLRMCRQCDLLDSRFDPLLKESDEIVRILAAIVHNTIRNTETR